MRITSVMIVYIRLECGRREVGFPNGISCERTEIDIESIIE